MASQHIQVDWDRRYMYIHGWIMWATWGILGLIIISFNRYLKHYWRANGILHAVLGTIIMISNLVYGLGAIYKNNWVIKRSIHGIAGSLVSIMMPTALIGGIGAKFLMNKL